MNIQYIEHNGHKQFAVIPVDFFQELLEKSEMLQDIKDFDIALNSSEEKFPIELFEKTALGESKLKVWREYRQLTQVDLSKIAKVAQATITQIETGKRTGTVKMLKKLADALNIDIDFLV